jgi:7-cyano-7-deazaguanine synthase
MSKTKVLVVLSGGQDSTTCLALAVRLGYEVYTVTFDYGQRHSREIQAAKDVANLMGIPASRQEVVKVGAILNGTSPLTNKSEELETYKDFDSMDAIIGDRVEKTFVPMRNALFLTLAANRAACIGAQQIYTGVCQADNANYPDCRQDFIDAQAHTIHKALGATGIEIVTPLMNMSKARSIEMMYDINMLWILAFTHTAYDGAYPPLGQDHASVLRARGFEEADLPDPLMVRAHLEGLLEGGYPDTANYDAHRLGKGGELSFKIQDARNDLTVFDLPT